MTDAASTRAAGVPRRRFRARTARERIDRAAVEIAATPERWPAIVNDLRASLGQVRYPEGAINPKAFQFIRSEVAGHPAVYPVARLQPLAGGGMNAVLRSRDLFAGREIAVRKQLPAESAVEAAARAKRDVLIEKRLRTLGRHPVIPRFWATGTVDGEKCEVFDFAPGLSLSRFVAQKGMTYGALLDIGLHGARALQYLHANGLIHCDVKPENFCVAERMGRNGEPTVRVSLIDFDIVSAPEEQIAQYALGNSLEGTLPYMPPENFSGLVPEDPNEARRMVYSKDVFALGLTLARVVMGRFPLSFHTSMTSLVEKKTAGDETELDLPESLPATLRTLLVSMTSSLWQERPSLQTVVRTLGRLKDATTPADRRRLVAAPLLELAAPTVPARAAAEMVGPYRLVNRSFAPRPLEDGQLLPLAELQDPFGRKLVGVPFAFRSRENEQAFYDERCALLEDLNAVRLRHPELFPGSFRDLVREERDGDYLVWILRPLLENAKDLRRFLAEDRPGAPLKERLAILRRTAEALAVLEEAGYMLPRVTTDLIFFVPQPPEAAASVTRAAQTRPIRRLFDVPTKEPGLRYRQELMGTASARKGIVEKAGQTVADLLDIAREIGVFEDLGPADRTLLLQIATAATWQERRDIVVLVEMQGAR